MHVTNAKLTEITGHNNPSTTNKDAVMDDGKWVIGGHANVMTLMHVVFAGAVADGINSFLLILAWLFLAQLSLALFVSPLS